MWAGCGERAKPVLSLNEHCKRAKVDATDNLKSASSLNQYFQAFSGTLEASSDTAHVTCVKQHCSDVLCGQFITGCNFFRFLCTTCVQIPLQFTKQIFLFRYVLCSTFLCDIHMHKPRSLPSSHPHGLAAGALAVKLKAETLPAAPQSAPSLSSPMQTFPTDILWH